MTDTKRLTKRQATRNRKKETRAVRASELVPNPQNWRSHPEAQRAAMEGILAEVGDLDYLKVVELLDGRLMLLDGHLRADIRGDETVDVVVLDLDEAEQRLVLATFDPLAAMAEVEGSALTELLALVSTEEEPLGILLAEMAEEHRTVELSTPRDIQEPTETPQELRAVLYTEYVSVFEAAALHHNCPLNHNSGF